MRLFERKRIDQCSEKEYLEIRGKDIGMIFQEPMTALNSVFKIKNQLIESILVHKKKSNLVNIITSFLLLFSKESIKS